MYGNIFFVDFRNKLTPPFWSWVKKIRDIVGSEITLDIIEMVNWKEQESISFIFTKFLKFLLA